MEKPHTQTHTSEIDQDYTLSPVPQSARKGFGAMFFIMLGFTFFSASMSVGAKMANGLNLSQFLWAIAIGGLILGAYTGVLGFIGSQTGLSLDLLARRSFGSLGSYLPSALISFTQVGWFGVGAAMFAIPASELLGISPWILVILAGSAMTASAYFGIRGLEMVSYISVPLIAGLGIYSMVLASNAGGGLVAIFDKSSGTLSLSAAVGMVIGSFVSGGTATPNFVRFAKSNWSAVITTVFAFFLGNTLMFMFGAVGGAFTGKEDIFYVMIAQGLTAFALIVLGANIWTTNDNALYTSSLGIANITKLPRRPVVLIAGLIGTVSAIWLYNNFVSWLSFLNATLPPIGAIITLDYFLHRAKYHRDSEETKSINWFAVLGVIVGALVGNYVSWGITAINAMVIASLIYFIGTRVYKE